MRYPAGDLAILSAESYNDGLKHHASASVLSSSAAAVRARKTTAVVDVAAVAQESQHDGPARKRRKTASPDAGGEDAEEKKRSRGRPRLEPKDETAQDRRRTQIRLAQRAYRNRKENAIQTLERRVQELKDTNEEMNNAFLRLHDYAVGCGLLDRMPEVGRQLRETTQKFLSLARKSNEEGYHDDDPRDSDTQPTAATTTRCGHARRKSSSVEVIDCTPPSHVQDTTTPSHRQLFGGLLVTQEQVSLSDMDASSSLPSLSHVDSQPTPDYEVITYPTLDNASFPFGFGSDFDFSTDDLTNSNPTNTTATTGGGGDQPDFSDITNLSSTLYPSLPVPNSYASQEVTFGRRFQRTALERAWTLVTMPNPPQKRFSRVFGFCLLFEPLESIKARLRRGLDRTSGESLNNWQYPFLHLGGGGTHFDTTSAAGQRLGNQGTVDVMRSKASGSEGSFSMGPFDAKTSAARDMLDVSQYLPQGSAGFGAEFYDCDEIEMYLHQRGVVIPPAADFVTVEIDVGAFDDESGTEQSVGGGPSSESSARSTCPTLSPGASSGDDTNMTTAPSDFAQTQHTDMWQFDAGEFGEMKTGGGGVAGMGQGGMAVAVAPGTKRVTVDVNLLIFEMVERATCLGRSPGLRKQDINGAFRTATKYNS
ncbi:hypothetical protein GE09DRAFT_1230312 [Coniochaeta sp. 2T2.1]|nr:hypothetical protein GE09DRAFT_1230312 [Coniochaeta sp. 2T2.1]